MFYCKWFNFTVKNIRHISYQKTNQRKLSNKHPVMIFLGKRLYLHSWTFFVLLRKFVNRRKNKQIRRKNIAFEVWFNCDTERISLWCTETNEKQNERKTKCQLQSHQISQVPCANFELLFFQVGPFFCCVEIFWSRLASPIATQCRQRGSASAAVIPFKLN